MDSEVQSSQFHSSVMGQGLKTACFKCQRSILFNLHAAPISNGVNILATLVSVALLLGVSEERSWSLHKTSAELIGTFWSDLYNCMRGKFESLISLMGFKEFPLLSPLDKFPGISAEAFRTLHNTAIHKISRNFKNSPSWKLVGIFVSEWLMHIYYLLCLWEAFIQFWTYTCISVIHSSNWFQYNETMEQAQWGR